MQVVYSERSSRRRASTTNGAKRAEAFEHNQGGEGRSCMAKLGNNTVNKIRESTAKHELLEPADTI
jgi:hypothetical protein